MVVIFQRVSVIGFCWIFLSSHSLFPIPPFFVFPKMASLCLYHLNYIPIFPSLFTSHLLPTHFHGDRVLRRRRRNRGGGEFVAFSTHSNPRILKSNRRLPYGRLFSPYADEDEEEEDEEEEKGSEAEFSDVSFFFPWGWMFLLVYT